MALEFATTVRLHNDVSIFWVHAGSIARFEKGYADIAKKADILGWDLPTTNKLQLVKDWLEGDHCGKWLLIIDNADDIGIFYGATSDRAADYLPRSKNGSILLTTRDRRIALNFAGASNVLNLEALESTYSAELIKSRLGAHDASTNIERMRLADTLENIPLALVQASAYICNNMISIDEYLNLYQSNDVFKIELLSEAFEDETRDQEATNPIAATFAISFE
jgi:hypothetical protein